MKCVIEGSFHSTSDSSPAQWTLAENARDMNSTESLGTSEDKKKTHFLKRSYAELPEVIF